MKNLIFSSPAFRQAQDGQVKQYKPSFPLDSSPLSSQSGMMLMTVLGKEQFHIYWINLFRNIMGPKDLLFLNPAYN